MSNCLLQFIGKEGSMGLTKNYIYKIQDVKYKGDMIILYVNTKSDKGIILIPYSNIFTFCNNWKGI